MADYRNRKNDKVTKAEIIFDKDKVERFRSQQTYMTLQKMVDFLLDGFWWSKQGPVKIPESQDVPKFDAHKNVLARWQEPKLTAFQSYLAEMAETTSSEQLQKLMKVAKNDSELSGPEKLKIELAGAEKVKTFYF